MMYKTKIFTTAKYEEEGCEGEWWNALEKEMNQFLNSNEYIVIRNIKMSGTKASSTGGSAFSYSSGKGHVTILMIYSLKEEEEGERDDK